LTRPTYVALRNTTTLYIESFAGSVYSVPPPPLIGLEKYDLSSDPDEETSLMQYPQSHATPSTVMAGSAQELSGRRLRQVRGRDRTLRRRPLRRADCCGAHFV
jgi:hypothetical protein